MSNNGVRRLWGREFDIVQQGLDESQVIEFVNELIEQRDILLRERKTLLSYVRPLKATEEREHRDEKRNASTIIEVDQDSQPPIEITELERMMKPPSAEATGFKKTGAEGPAPYQGEVELAILPPLDAAELLQFERRLRSSLQLKILSTDGSPSEGSLIKVLLNEPQSILEGLKQMPEVKEAAEKLDTSIQAKGIPSLFENTGGKRIWITLSKSDDKGR